MRSTQGAGGRADYQLSAHHQDQRRLCKPADRVKILLYHSISSATGPTNISLATFQRQLEVLANVGYQAISMTDVLTWQRGDLQLSLPTIVFTFDDGFSDFSEQAVQELAERGWTATVFLPVQKIGGTDDWETPTKCSPARRLMAWETIKKLSRQGTAFGCHSATHVDLTKVPLPQLRREVVDSKNILQERLGQPVQCFAPPFGKVNQPVLELIRANYDISVGTDLDEADATSDIHNLPRIEMHYFRNLKRWKAYLEGRARTYLAVRRSGRKIRQLFL